MRKLISLLLFATSSFQASAILPNRPPTVQKAVDKAFSDLQNHVRPTSAWLYDGGNRGFYEHLWISTLKLIKRAIAQDNERSDIYIMEIGAGHGFGWGTTVANYLKETYGDDQSHHFHVV